MRTNIVLDDKLIARAQKLTGIKTKREVVQEALRTLILLREQGEIRSLRGCSAKVWVRSAQIGWIACQAS